MRWLRDRIHGGRRNQRPDEPAGEPPVPVTPVQKAPAPDSGRPRLVLLVRDAAGPASYQLHSFEDESEAASFVQFWFPGDADHGVIAFWASHREPEVMAGERPAEVVVLVRDETRSKSVCPFSFAGMDLAQSWIARESDRGLELHPDHVLMFWAVPARISRDHWGQVHLWPSEPPAPRSNGRRATLTKPVFQPKPESPPPTRARAPEHRRAPFEQQLELPAELQASIEEAVTAAEVAPQPPAEEPAELLAETPAGVFAPAQEAREPAAQEPATPEEAADPLAETPAGVFALAEEAWEPPAQEPAEVETAAELRPETAVALPETPEESSATTDEALPAGEQPMTFEEAASWGDDEALEPCEETDNLLGRKRWKQREGPFRGFGSPPGKF